MNVAFLKLPPSSAQRIPLVQPFPVNEQCVESKQGQGYSVTFCVELLLSIVEFTMMHSEFIDWQLDILM